MALTNAEALPQRAPSEQRREKRYEFPRGLKAQLYLQPQKAGVAVTIINVSKSGLCVRAKHRLPVAEEVFLLLDKRRLALTCVWSLPDAGSSMRYGFASAIEGIDVLTAVTAAGASLANAVEKFRNDEEDFIHQFCSNGVSMTVKSVER